MSLFGRDVRDLSHVKPGVLARQTTELPDLLNLEESDSYEFIYRPFSGVQENGPISLKRLVGAGGFEPPTPCAQGRCATRLRYAPTPTPLLILEHFQRNRHLTNCFFARKRHLEPAKEREQ